MSLTSVLSTATSSLLTTQFQISTVTNNISNASVAGATQKTYEQSSSASLTSALSTGDVTRLTNSYLSQTTNASASINGASSVVNSYLTSYDNALGSLANGNDISSRLTGFQTALTTLANSPAPASNKSGVVNAATALATSISSLSHSIQSLRNQASTDIGSTVTAINTDLKSLQVLNGEIATANQTGSDATSLEDQRDTTLTDLSSKMGVQYYTTPSNQLVVYDNNGDQLLGSQASTLSYGQTGALSSASTYPATIAGIQLNGGKDVTSQITGGTLGGLLQLRDTTLVGQQQQLDQLASGLITTANGITSNGSSSPAPTTLTSSTSGLTAGAAFAGTGKISVATTSATGAVVTTATLDLSTYHTVQDLLTGLNGVPGVTATVNASGNLVIASSSSANGVAINGTLSGAASSVGSPGQTFSSYFGFNNLFSGVDSATIAVSSALTTNPNALITGTLNASTTLAAGNVGVAPSDSSTITSLAAALTTTVTLAQTGAVAAKSMTMAAAASTFVSSAASLISNASTVANDNDTLYSTATNALSNATGISTDQQTALLTQYQSQYEAASELISSVKAMFASLITMMGS